MWIIISLIIAILYGNGLVRFYKSMTQPYDLDSIFPRGQTKKE